MFQIDMTRVILQPLPSNIVSRPITTFTTQGKSITFLYTLDLPHPRVAEVLHPRHQHRCVTDSHRSIVTWEHKLSMQRKK